MTKPNKKKQAPSVPQVNTLTSPVAERASTDEGNRNPSEETEETTQQNKVINLDYTKYEPSIKAPIVPPVKMVRIKQEFTIGSLVSISGRDLDFGRWKSRATAPTFYGCVEDEKEHLLRDKTEVKEGQSYVAFVVAGYYEWYNKNLPNVLQSGYDDMVLTLCKSPPSNIINREPTSEDDVTNLFCKSKKGWLVKSHEAQCYGCGDPWCLLHNDRKRLKGVITTIGT